MAGGGSTKGASNGGAPRTPRSARLPELGMAEKSRASRSKSLSALEARELEQAQRQKISPENAELFVDVIKQERHCTDVLFLLAFLAFWVGALVIAILAFQNGDPEVLLYGLDYQGNLCGSGALGDFKVRYWPNPNSLYALNQAEDSAVWEAPFGITIPISFFNAPSALSICVQECPVVDANSTLAWVCLYPNDPRLNASAWAPGATPVQTLDQWLDLDYDYYDSLNDELQSTSVQLRGPCYPRLLESDNLFWSCQYIGDYVEGQAYDEWEDLVAQNEEDVKLCDAGPAEEFIGDILSASGEQLDRYIADLGITWPVIVVCGIVLPLGFTLVYLILVRFTTMTLAYLSLLLLNLSSLAVTLLFFVKAGVIGEDSISAVIGDAAVDAIPANLDPAEDNREALKIAGIVFAVFTVLIFIFSILMLPTIRLAVAILKVAAKAIYTFPHVLLAPVLPFLLLTGFFILWVVVSVYLYSAGEVSGQECIFDNLGEFNVTAPPPPGRKLSFFGDAYDFFTIDEECTVHPTDECGFEYKWQENFQYMLIYLFFGLLWMAQFISGINQMIIAGVIMPYYWRNPTDKARMDRSLGRAIWRTFRFHLGSIAIGSFLVATLQFIRTIIMYLQRKADQLRDKSGFARAVLGCISCCLCFTEWIVKTVNKNGTVCLSLQSINISSCLASSPCC